MFLRSCRLAIVSWIAFASFSASASELLGDPKENGDRHGYAIVVSAETQGLAEWKQVVDSLAQKHAQEFDVSVVTYISSIEEALPDLQKQRPRFTCFVARHAEASRGFVAHVHQLTRRYDKDPYADTFWGILTGFDANNALDIAAHADPLVVQRVAAGTEVQLEACKEGVWYCELVKNRMVRKRAGETGIEEKGPDDTTLALANTLTDYKAQLFVTSGHATERNWQIGFRYKNGYFRSEAGNLFGVDTEGKRFAIESSNPKVYLPIGNCLMGHIDGPDAMALAFLNRAGVKQMIGYTVPTWFGYGGWGMLDYFVEQPGRYTMNQAFIANHHALIHRLSVTSPHEKAGERRGLEFDRDVVAFYGDPAWSAKMSAGSLRWDQSLTRKDNEYTLTITPRAGEESFSPPNTNGAQRGFRPIVAFLPHRISNPKLLSGHELNPTIADDFVLVPNPRDCDPSQSYVIQFSAE